MEVEPKLRSRAQPQAAEAEDPDEADPDEERPRDAVRSKRKLRCAQFCASPQFKMIIFCIIGFVPIYGVTMNLRRILEVLQCTSFFCKLRHWFISCWLTVQFLYNFAASQWTDPGGTLKHKPPYESTGQYELNLNSKADDADKDSQLKNGDGEMHILFAPNFCEHCQHWKPPRSHHCSICGRCVLRMDHHCPFTGNCIGMRNHGHFMLMYVFAIVGLFYCLYLSISVLVRSPEFAKGFSVTGAGSMAGAKGNGKVPLFSPGFAGFVTYLAVQVLLAAGVELGVLIITTVIALSAVLGFGLPALWMASTGGTIIENQFPMKEYVQIKAQVYCPLGPGFYQRSRMENFRVIFGPRWWLRLMCPVRGGTLDVTPGLCPTPGAPGLAALKGRITQVENEGVQQSVSSCKELGFNPGPAEITKSGDV